MSQLGDVSVIIPNYNYAAYVGQAIESVLAQTYRNFEIIVVNNGSTDNSMGILSKYVDRITLLDQTNLGQSGARNAGLKKSTGDVIAFLDADDFWEPEKLEKQLDCISQTCQLIYCGITHFMKDDSVKSFTRLPLYKGDCREVFVRNPGVGIVLGGESTVVITRDLVNKVGGFDMRLSSSSGWDFYRRCSIHTHFDYVSEPLSNYRIHDNNMSRSTFANVQDIRKSFVFMAQSLDSATKTSTLLNGFVYLELSFVKTFLRQHMYQSLFLEVLKMPLRSVNFFQLCIRRYFS
jgi:glycosyltransferase involved in cell wall biosynthesis